MLALRIVPARCTPWAAISAYIACWVRTVTSWERSMVWSPSISTSGSTMGTTPASWHRAA